MPLNHTRRLESENAKAHILAGPRGLGHAIHITLAYDRERMLKEVAFTGRSVVGQDLDQLLVDAGIWVSRAIQWREPLTGAPLPLDILARSQTVLTCPLAAAALARPLLLTITRRPWGDVAAIAIGPSGAALHPLAGAERILDEAAMALTRMLNGLDPDAALPLQVAA